MLRFFTVYGPWGRPDMALFKFSAALFEAVPSILQSWENDPGFHLHRDLIEAMSRLASQAPPQVEGESAAHGGDKPFTRGALARRQYRNETPIALMDFVARHRGRDRIAAKCNFMDMQQGDVPLTFADTALLSRLTGFRPKTPLNDGVKSFVACTASISAFENLSKCGRVLPGRGFVEAAFAPD